MQFADGGVVGFDAGGAVDTKMMRLFPEEYEKLRREALAKAALPVSAKLLPEEEAIFRQLREPPKAPPAPIPDIQVAGATQAAAPAPTPQRAPRPGTGRPAAPAPAPVAAAPAPAVGIAQNLPAAPTLAGAVQEAQRVMPITSLDRNREAVEELKRMRAAMPDAGLATLAALEEERRVAADIKRRMDESARSRGISAWLAGGPQLGASGRNVGAFQEAELRREQDYASLNTVRVAKMDAIRDANNARKVGDQEKYLDALNKISELERAEKQIQAQLAGAGLTAATNVRSQDIGAATADADRRSREMTEAANRATQLKIANIRAAAQENPGGKEALAMARVQAAINGSPLLKALAEKAKFDPTAAAQFAAEEERLYLRLAPELLVGAGAGAGGAPSTSRAAADAILQQGK
jgi:hypothetical protein